MQDYVVCRCEDVTLGDVRRCLSEGPGVSLNEVKRRLRAGMGWCQGRVCGPLLAELSGTEEVLDRNRVLRPTSLARVAQCGPPPLDGAQPDGAQHDGARHGGNENDQAATGATPAEREGP